jgi:hypothetical protein
VLIVSVNCMFIYVWVGSDYWMDILLASTSNTNVHCESYLLSIVFEDKASIMHGFFFSPSFLSFFFLFFVLNLHISITIHIIKLVFYMVE